MITENLLTAVRSFEGLAQVRSDGLVHPYKCPAGFWTIGYGSLCSASQQPLTRADCEQLLRAQLLEHQAQALRLSPCLASLPPGWLDAITDFVFNLGTARYAGSTLRKRVNDQDAAAAAHELQKWVFGGGKKLPGLVARRQWEAKQIMHRL